MVSNSSSISRGNGPVQAGSFRRPGARPSLDQLDLVRFESEGGHPAKSGYKRKPGVAKAKATPTVKGEDLKAKLAELVMKRGDVPAQSSPATQVEASEVGSSVELSRLMDDGAGSALTSCPPKASDKESIEIDRALCRLGDEGIIF